MTNSLQILDTAPALTQWRSACRNQGARIGLVPTMGNLHAGHLALIETARAQCDQVIATIFVNPMQFGPTEDLDRYPKTFAADCEGLKQAGCDALFTPSAQLLYPRGLQNQTVISVPTLSRLHCGKSRPGHFDGVCTIVAKLFNLIQPEIAYFGLKDFQQFQIIKRMVEDLNLAIELQGVPIVRDARGLALSSRNGYLTAQQLELAPALHQILQETAALLQTPRPDFRGAEHQALIQLEKAGFKPDYLSICEQDSLDLAHTTDTPLIILAAAYLGTTRLIDNLQIQPPPQA